MLNLLISVISDTYDRVQLDFVSVNYRLRCDMLIELFMVLNICKGDNKNPRYISYLKLKVVDEDIDEVESKWEGKLNSRKKEMKKLKKAILENQDQ